VDRISRLKAANIEVLFYKKIKEVIKRYDKNETLFYFFTINTSFIALLIPNLIYINEESDMLFDRSKKTIVRKLIILANKRIIKKSYKTVMTSQGFADYYYGERIPKNIVIIPNKVSAACLKLPAVAKEPFDVNHIKFAFTGNARYDSIFNMCKMVGEHFPQHEFHFYGTLNYFTEAQKKAVAGYKNVFVHGPFKNPDDLPEIYSKIDFVISTYDAGGVNVQYAESNKIYESMFFETPIFVSTNTVLEKIVNRNNMGFAINALDDKEVIRTINSITAESYEQFRTSLKAIDKKESVNDNAEFFRQLKKELGQ
jgi:glycosyltransferase involved in cell wall biosynthesis